MTRALTAAGAMMALAVSSTALAQGQSQAHKKGTPPSRGELTAPAAATPVASVSGVTPFAWIDDASLLAPGAVSLAISVVRWQGGGASEVDAPIVDASIGLTPRLHLTASVPHVIGSADPAGAAGGIGTSYFSAKISVLDDPKRTVKVAVAPTIELLGRGVVQSTGGRRVHFGLPVSAEIERRGVRFYAGGGFFSRGVVFAGLGAGIHAAEHVFVGAGFNRSWRTTDVPDAAVAARDRKEISGTVAYIARPWMSVYASVARTVATLEENGAGTSIAGGVSFFVAPGR